MKSGAGAVATEDEEQMALVSWARMQEGVMPELGLLFAVPNGGWRAAATAARMRRTGTRAGVPDLCLPVARGGYHGLWIELKRTHGGRVSDAQRWWMDHLSAQGYLCHVCLGWLAAADVIREYLRMDGGQEHEKGYDDRLSGA